MIYRKSTKRNKKELLQKYEEYDFININIEPSINTLIDYLNKIYKDIKKYFKSLKEFVNRNFDKIIIMVHSLLGIDDEYYHSILS